MCKLIILSGPAGCGKSTWAQNYIKENPNVIVVSRDKIRFSMLKEGEHYFSHEDEVFAKFCQIIREYLTEGKTVIADATHLNEKSRKLLIDTINLDFKPENLEVVSFKIPLFKTFEQNAQRTGPHEVVPKSVIRRMFYSQTDPKDDTFIKYKNIIYVKG